MPRRSKPFFVAPLPPFSSSFSSSSSKKSQKLDVFEDEDDDDYENDLNKQKSPELIRGLKGENPTAYLRRRMIINAAAPRLHKARLDGSGTAYTFTLST